jgi:hypothetical protein
VLRAPEAFLPAQGVLIDLVLRNAKFDLDHDEECKLEEIFPLDNAEARLLFLNIADILIFVVKRDFM